MSTLSGDFWRGVSISERNSGLSMRETHWGFAVSEVPSQYRLEMIAEATMKFFGLTMILVTGALWLLPNSLYSYDVLMMKIGLTAAFGTLGFAVYSHANRGWLSEIRIDVITGEIRIGTVNSAGRFSARRTIKGSDIESAFLRRAGGQRDAQLHLRVSGRAGSLRLIDGSERALVPVIERISQAFRSRRTVLG